MEGNDLNDVPLQENEFIGECIAQYDAEKKRVAAYNKRVTIGISEGVSIGKYDSTKYRTLPGTMRKANPAHPLETCVWVGPGYRGLPLCCKHSQGRTNMGETSLDYDPGAIGLVEGIPVRFIIPPMCSGYIDDYEVTVPPVDGFDGFVFCYTLGSLKSFEAAKTSFLKFSVHFDNGFEKALLTVLWMRKSSSLFSLLPKDVVNLIVQHMHCKRFEWWPSSLRDSSMLLGLSYEPPYNDIGDGVPTHENRRQVSFANAEQFASQNGIAFLEIIPAHLDEVHRVAKYFILRKAASLEEQKKKTKRVSFFSKLFGK